MDATAVYNLISTAAADGFEEFTTLFAYEGFNPEMVHVHMAKIKSDRGISDSEFVDDMRALLTLGAMKGNYTSKNKKKISEAGKTKADALYKKYGMKEGSLGADKKAIILPRVISAFPELTTKVILRIAPRDFGEKTRALPKIMKNPVFPALLPTNMENSAKEHLLWLYTVYSAEQTITISNIIKDFETAYDKQKQYVYIAHHSSVPAEAMRVKVIKAQLEEIVQGVSDTKGLTTTQKPAMSVGAAEVRKAINEL